MGIFDRLSTLIKSNLNELISSAENPVRRSKASFASIIVIASRRMILPIRP